MPITTIDQTAADLISKARAQLILRHAFVGTLALRLKVRQTSRVPTMAVDGETLWFNPQFVRSLPFPQLVGVVAHEVYHCALSHPWRRGNREHKLFNVACDHVTNHIVGADFELPESAHRDPEFAESSAEEVYRVLLDRRPPPSAGGVPQDAADGDGEGDPSPQGAGGDSDDDDRDDDDQPADGTPEPQDEDGDEPAAPPPPSAGEGDDDTGDDDPQPAGSSGDCGGCGEVLDYPVQASDPLAAAAEREYARQEFEIAVMQAAQVAKNAGELPAGIERLIAELKKPQVPWTQVLRRYMQEVSKDDFSWRRPNRRLIAQGIYVPGRYSKRIGGVVIGVDVSGSISPHELDHFVSEINGIIDEVQPPWIEVIYCSSVVHKVERFEQTDYPVTLKPEGTGGTAFYPVFDYCDEHEIEPVCCVYLTDLDGYGDAFHSPPRFPVIWVTTMKEAAPFGEVVRLDTTLSQQRRAA